MKKLILLLLCIPLISFGQYGESRNVEIDVVDQYGNSIGTMSMRARYVDSYSNGLEVAVDKYIQYLEEKETREQAEKKFNQLNSRLSNVGMSKVPSWAKGTAVQAASEAMVNVRESQNYNNSSYSSSRRVSESEYNEMIRSYNKKVVWYNNLNPKKTLSKKPLVNGSVSLSKWNSDVVKNNKLVRKVRRFRKKNKSENSGEKGKLLQLTSKFGKVKTEVITKAMDNSGLTKYFEIKRGLDSITNNLQTDLSEAKNIERKIIIYEDYIKKVKAMGINNN